MGIENDTSCNCKNGENLRKIFKAFKERGAISFDYTDLNGGKICVNRDFGNIKSGKILLYNFTPIFSKCPTQKYELTFYYTI